MNPGRDRSPGRRRRTALLVALVTTVAVAATLLVLDQRRLRSEVEAVDRCRATAEDSARQVERRLAAMWTYLAPARVRPDADAGLTQRLMAESVDDVRPSVVEAGEVCTEVAVRPWHPGTEAARANVETYLRARLASLDRIADDPDAYVRPDEDLARLRERAFPLGAPDGRA